MSRRKITEGERKDGNDALKISLIATGVLGAAYFIDKNHASTTSQEEIVTQDRPTGDQVDQSLVDQLVKDVNNIKDALSKEEENPLGHQYINDAGVFGSNPTYDVHLVELVPLYYGFSSAYYDTNGRFFNSREPGPVYIDNSAKVLPRRFSYSRDQIITMLNNLKGINDLFDVKRSYRINYPLLNSTNVGRFNVYTILEGGLLGFSTYKEGGHQRTFTNIGNTFLQTYASSMSATAALHGAEVNNPPLVADYGADVTEYYKDISMRPFSPNYEVSPMEISNDGVLKIGLKTFSTPFKLFEKNSVKNLDSAAQLISTSVSTNQILFNGDIDGLEILNVVYLVGGQIPIPSMYTIDKKEKYIKLLVKNLPSSINIGNDKLLISVKIATKKVVGIRSFV